MKDSESSISSVPADFEPVSNFMTTDSSEAGAPSDDTGPLIIDEHQSIIADNKNEIDPQLLRTIVAAVKSETKSTVTVATETEQDLFVDQFSADLIRKLSAKDAFIQKIRAAKNCRQTGKNLACIPHVTKPAHRRPVTTSFDELELDFLGPLFHNPPTQHHVLVAIDGYSR